MVVSSIISYTYNQHSVIYQELALLSRLIGSDDSLQTGLLAWLE